MFAAAIAEWAGFDGKFCDAGGMYSHPLIHQEKSYRVMAYCLQTPHPASAGARAAEERRVYTESFFASIAARRDDNSHNSPAIRSMAAYLHTALARQRQQMQREKLVGTGCRMQRSAQHWCCCWKL